MSGGRGNAAPNSRRRLRACSAAAVATSPHNLPNAAARRSGLCRPASPRRVPNASSMREIHRRIMRPQEIEEERDVPCVARFDRNGSPGVLATVRTKDGATPRMHPSTTRRVPRCAVAAT